MMMTALSLQPMSPAALLVCAGFGYLLGSVPFGLLLTRLAGLGDIRDTGSGNIGATNVLRTGRKWLAAATLLLDAAKGALAVIGAGAFGPDAAMIGGVAAILGHIFPAALRFRGGKGVATYLGVLVVLDWFAAVVFAATWLTVALLTRFSSAAALAAIFAALASIYLLGKPLDATIMAAVSIIVIARHRTNIAQLLNGTETRIGSRAGASEASLQQK